MAQAVGYTGSYGSGFGDTNQSSELSSQKFNVYQPEQWEAWRKLQSGQAYSPSTLENYMANYIDPTIQKTVDARTNQARNQYNTPSGYFSASSALAQQRAMQEGSEQATATRAQAMTQWEQLRNEMMAKMLEQRPEETMVYRPGSSSISSGIAGGLTSLSTGNPGVISGYKDIPFGTTGSSTPTSISTTPTYSSGSFQDLGSNTLTGQDYNNLYAGMGARLLDSYGSGLGNYSSSYPTSSSVEESWSNPYTYNSSDSEWFY
jgi:hypothetical protein